MNDINSDMCKTGSYLEQIKFLTQRQYTPDLGIALSRRRTQLESQVLDLEKEKRQEYLACWKDMAYLSKGLLSALKDYWNLSNRKNFLGVENDNGYGRALPKAEAYSRN